MPPTEGDLVTVHDETLATAGAAELANLLDHLGLPVEEVDIESLRRRIRRSSWG